MPAANSATCGRHDRPRDRRAYAVGGRRRAFLRRDSHQESASLIRANNAVTDRDGDVVVLARQNSRSTGMPGGLPKSLIEEYIQIQLQYRFPQGHCGSGVIKIGSFSREADLVLWKDRLPRDIFSHTKKHRIPAPDIWVEVFFHQDSSDRQRALRKPEEIRSEFGSACEILLIALPDPATFVPPPAQPLPALVASRTRQPSSHFYVKHWRSGSASAKQYNVDRSNGTVSILNDALDLAFKPIVDILQSLSCQVSVPIECFKGIKRRLEVAEDQLDEARRELAEAKQELEQAKQEREQARREREGLSRELAATVRRVSDLEAVLAGLRPGPVRKRGRS